MSKIDYPDRNRNGANLVKPEGLMAPAINNLSWRATWDES